MKALAPLLWICISLVGLISGCVTNIPVEDYPLARAAVEAARDAEASRYAPGLWYKAEEAYKRGEKAFTDRDYPVAQKLFLQAKFYAEKAENTARVTRFESGKEVP